MSVLAQNEVYMLLCAQPDVYILFTLLWNCGIIKESYIM